MAVIMIVRGAEAELPGLSLTLTVNGKVPSAVGVLLITPVVAASVSPVGREPELMLQP